MSWLINLLLSRWFQRQRLTSEAVFRTGSPRYSFRRNVRGSLSCRISAGPHCVMSSLPRLSSLPGVAHGLTDFRRLASFLLCSNRDIQAFIYTRLSTVHNAHLFSEQMLVEVATYTHTYSQQSRDLSKPITLNIQYTGSCYDFVDGFELLVPIPASLRHSFQFMLLSSLALLFAILRRVER